MLRKFAAWLLVFSLGYSSMPVFAAVYALPQTESESATIQADVPPTPASTDGRRGEERSKQNTSAAMRGKGRGPFQWRSFCLMVLLVIPCLVLSMGNRADAEDFFFQSTGFFEDVFDAEFPTFSQHEPDHEPPRYAPAPPKLSGCWLSGGRIPIAKIEDYPRIPSLDHEGGLLDTWRPNLIGKAVPEEWDFQNLINTDRPDFTDATFSVGKDVALLETGYTFRKTNSEGLNLERRQLPESLLRVGMTDELELRIKWVGYVMTKATDTSTGLTQNTFGTDDLQLGFKYEIAQQHGWRPMLTYVGGFIVPTGTNGVSANQVQPFANLVYGWGIRRWLYLKGSTGVDFSKTSDVTHVVSGSLQEGPAVQMAEDNNSLWHQSFSLLFQASPRVGGFLEWFSFFSSTGSDSRASHYLDTGLYIYLTPNVQLDVRIGERVSGRADTLFTGAGFSTRW